MRTGFELSAKFSLVIPINTERRFEASASLA
jgi:hypothetical protein